jgi:hypothetical protein
LRVIFIAMPASLLSVMMMMGLRGTGDARTPLIFMLVSVGVDLVLNPVLILGLGPIPAMGIGGSAAATAAAGVISLIGVILYAYAKDLPLRLRAQKAAHPDGVDRPIQGLEDVGRQCRDGKEQQGRCDRPLRQILRAAFSSLHPRHPLSRTRLADQASRSRAALNLSASAVFSA